MGPSAVERAPSTTPRRPSLLRAALKPACAVSFVLLLGAAWRAYSYSRDVADAAKRRSVDLTAKAAARLDGELRGMMAAVQGVADDLSSGALPAGAIDSRLQRTLEDDPGLRNANVAFLPYRFKPGLKLYTPYWVRDPGGVHPATDVSDYTDPDIFWYRRTVDARKPTWVAPFFRKTAKTLTVVYSAPFFKRGELEGVVSATISLDELKRMVEDLDLGSSGFPELIAADGTYLYHPRNEYVLARKTITELGAELGDKDRLAVAPKAARGESGIVDHVSTNTGLRSWFVYQAVPSAGWSLQTTFLRDDFPYDVNVLRRRLIETAAAATLFLLLSAALALDFEIGGRRGLWILSISASLIFLADVAVIWRVAQRLDAHAESNGLQVGDRARLRKLVDDYKTRCARSHAEPPVFVPTGVYVQTARFVDPDDALMTGYVWQRYDASTKGLSRGFTFLGASDVKIAEAYREKEGDAEIIRWSFQAVLHQRMMFSQYPLDQETLEINLRHQDLDHNVVLLPDLGAYKILASAAKPGLSEEFQIPGWTPSKAYFDMGGTIESTTFGLSRSVNKADFPGLGYNILLHRNLLDAFISSLGPIVIALILLFALQMVMTNDEQLARQIGPGLIVNICVSMFFVIVFAHISVRRSLAAAEIFYLEYFYFATYLMILWVGVDSIVFTRMKHVAWLQREDNLILKLLFWPVVTGFLFAATAATFY